jgi:hypothetical protein
MEIDERAPLALKNHGDSQRSHIAREALDGRRSATRAKTKPWWLAFCLAWWEL